ncbi:Bifunctional NAD(P)H-hydrate repair enzyme Nnr [subsurface metagenome]
MKIVTADQVKEIENQAVNLGISLETLMENAGNAVAAQVKQVLHSAVGKRVLVLVGPGNNGGDGLVAARYLHDWGAKVNICLCASRAQNDRNLELAMQCGIPIIHAYEGRALADLRASISSADVIIDALFGIGKIRPIEGIFKEVLQNVSMVKGTKSKPVLVAVDLPSGLDSDTGEVEPSCPSADITVTFGYPKIGLFNFPGAEKVGKLIIADIGIPQDLEQDIDVELITERWARETLPQRPLNAHKGSFGKVLVIAGSVNYIGAAYLACMGAARVGAGLVTLATATSLQPILASKLTEITYIPLPEAEPGIIGSKAVSTLQLELSNYDVLLLGCGLGQHPETVEFVKSLLTDSSQLSAVSCLILDADAVNTLAQIPQWWRKLRQDAILTPHPGEMARLLGISAKEVQGSRLSITQRSAKKWKKTVVLKGANTIVAAPNGEAKVNNAANPALASAGTGDVLAGAIAGLAAQGLSLFDAAACGVYLHSRAGDIVAEELGDAGVIATDLLPVLPRVIKALREG